MDIVPIDEVKIIICKRIKDFSKMALEYRNDDYMKGTCRHYVQEDIELLRKFGMINSDMYYDLITKSSSNDFDSLFAIKI